MTTRFPILKETTKIRLGKEEVPVTRFSNLSDALIESLKDMHIINPETGKSRYRYFQLPIEEGPLLQCLFEFFDMTGDFHVGCSADTRSPSFGFYKSEGFGDTRAGRFSLGYTRKLKLSTFFRNASFRNERGVRDLNALAHAYNKKRNSKERVSVGWHGWVGEERKDRRYGDSGKTGFCGTSIGLEFDGNFLERINGIEIFDEELCRFSSPLYGRHSPLLHLGEGTKLMEITQTYHKRKGELTHYHPQFIYAYNLHDLGYTIADAFYGIMQIAENILSSKKDIAVNQDTIRSACSGYKLIPRNFDTMKETRLYFDCGGGSR
jgi:hypothetical protein